MPRKLLPVARTRIEGFALTGGCDFHTPQLNLPPGVCRDALNFEANAHGGYSRIAGYERFDGHASPAVASYVVLTLSTTSGLAVTDTCNGQTSGATATVAYIDGNDVVLTKVTGTFVAAENFRKDPSTVIGTVDVVGPTISDRTKLAQYQYSASEIYRSDISAVPGSGQIRGLFVLNSIVYAFRNNAGGTALDLYKSSASGWTQIAFKYELYFTAGSGTEPSEGATITQSAVSATLRRVVVESGTWGGGTAAGRFIIEAPSGGSFSAGAFTAGVTATASGAETAITMSPGGRVEVDVGNCGHGIRVYGADGVNRGFEFDGTYLVPINTGQTTDTPVHVRVHAMHLFFSFGLSAQHSSIADPYQWTPLTGAAELTINEDITNFLVMPGDLSTPAMAITGKNSVAILYGTSSSDWLLVPMNPGVGSKAYAARALSIGYLYDDLGVVSLQAVQQFGNFATSAMTLNLRSFVNSRGSLVTDASVHHDKSQYRIFYSDGYELRLTIVNGQLVGGMPIEYANPMMVTCSDADATSGEVTYGGSDNGYVYKLDTGTSFDGAAISAYFDLAFARQQALRIVKRYHDVTFELQGDGYAEFSFGYLIGWGDDEVAQQSALVDVTPVFWDEMVWDAFFFDGRSLIVASHSLVGSGENIAVRVATNSYLWPAWTMNSMSFRYSVRKMLRA